MTVAALLRGAFQVDRKGWFPISAIWRAGGVAVPLIACYYLGHPAWGTLAAIGALYVGIASFDGIRPARIQRMVLTSIATALLTYVGGLVGPNDALTICVIGVAALFAGLLGSIFTSFSVVANLGLAVLIVFAGIRASSANPLGNAGLVLAGGAFQTLFMSLVGPIKPLLVERRMVATAYRELAQFVRHCGEEGADEIPASGVFDEATVMLEQIEFFGRKPQHVPLEQAMVTAECLRAAMVGFAQTWRTLTPDDSLKEAQNGLASAFDKVAEATLSGQTQDFTGLIPSTPDHPEIDYWLNLVRSNLSNLGQPVSAESLPRPSRTWVPQLRHVLALLTSQPLERILVVHALRYALLVTFCVAVTRLWHYDRNYWYPLTVAFIFRPDYATTLTRGVGRTIGTIAGVVFASALDYVVHPYVPVLIVMVVLGTWLSFSTYKANYATYAVGLTLFVVFSVSATGLPGRSVGEVRVLMTLLGIATAIGYSFIWPVWQSRSVGPVIADAFRAQAEYGRAVLAAISGDSTQLDANRHRARALRLEAEKLVSVAKIEPSWGRGKHLDKSEEQIALLARGAAEMLSVQAQTQAKISQGESEALQLSSTLNTAIDRADSLSGH